MKLVLFSCSDAQYIVLVDQSRCKSWGIVSSNINDSMWGRRGLKSEVSQAKWNCGCSFFIGFINGSFHLNGGGYSLVNGLYPCKRYFWLVQETPAPVSNWPLIASGLNGAIGCWLGIIEFSGRNLLNRDRKGPDSR